VRGSNYKTGNRCYILDTGYVIRSETNEIKHDGIFAGRIIGADVVEYNPEKDLDDVTAATTAKIVQVNTA
jgi:hypothetical protein